MDIINILVYRIVWRASWYAVLLVRPQVSGVNTNVSGIDRYVSDIASPN